MIDCVRTYYYYSNNYHTPCSFGSNLSNHKSRLFTTKTLTPQTLNRSVIEKDSCQVVTDAASVPFLQGATLDHFSELIRTGFRVIGNPNSDHACSCGTSFSIKV